MKIKHLQTIISRIQDQVCCPKCQTPFAREDLEINGLHGKNLEMASHCHKCQSKARITAEVNIQSVTTQQVESAKIEPTGKVSSLQLKSLSNSLKNFRSQNITDLFNS